MNDQNIERIYRLKGMVAVRLGAEITVLIVLMALPIVLLATSQFFHILLIIRVIICICAVVALIVLPAYGFITYKVATAPDKLKTFSLFSRQSANWSDLQSMTLRSTWGSRRFVVKTVDQEMTFPVWLEDIKALTIEIRSRLPAGSNLLSAGPRSFHQSLAASFVQVGKLLGALFFVGIFWMFFYSLSHQHQALANSPAVSHTADPIDKVFIFACCIIFTIAMLLRCALLALLPREAIVDQNGISIVSLFFRRSFAWSEVKNIGIPLFFMPECFMVRTTNGFFLIGDQLDGFDELEEEISARTAKAL